MLTLLYYLKYNIGVSCRLLWLKGYGDT